jgi:hypothetical protein
MHERTYAESIPPSDQSDISALAGQTILTVINHACLKVLGKGQALMAGQTVSFALFVGSRPNGLSAIFGLKKLSLEAKICSWTPESVFFKSPSRLVRGASTPHNYRS